MNIFYQFNFYLFGLIAIAASIVFVTRRSPVAAALWLVAVMFCLSALYIMLGAHFIGVIQVLVYAGAIMVVFLFVIMLLNLGQASEINDMRGKWGRLGAALVGLAMLAEVMVLARARFPDALTRGGNVVDQDVRALGAVGAVAKPLFSTNLLAFELTSILLLVAIIGAVVIGKRRVVA